MTTVEIENSTNHETVKIAFALCLEIEDEKIFNNPQLRDSDSNTTSQIKESSNSISFPTLT